MRGKEAVKSANRRYHEATERARDLQKQLDETKAERDSTVKELHEEVTRLRSEHVREAAAIAEKEIERQLAKKEEERKRRGLSDDIAWNTQLRMDRFIMNACRYVSMTKGLPPEQVLPMVLTWVTDRDVDGIRKIDFLLAIGVPQDGWVARTWKRFKNLHRALSRTTEVKKALHYGAISLDRAEQEHAETDGGHPEISPYYNPKWYPRKIEYGGIDVIDDMQKSVNGA